MKPGQGLCEAGRRVRKPLPESTLESEGAGRQPGSERDCRGPGRRGELAAAAQYRGRWRRLMPLGWGSDQTPGAGSRGASSRTRFSFQLLRSCDRSLVARGWRDRVRWPLCGRQGSGWAAGVTGSGSDPARGVRVCMGPGLGPPPKRTECPQRAGLRADRMSGAERWVSLEQALCLAAVDRMSLAEWHVHLPGSACPAAACAVGFAVVGRLKPLFANLFLLLGAVGLRSRE